MDYSTAEVAKLLKVAPYTILAIKGKNKHKLFEKVHWIRKRHPNGGSDGLWWSKQGLKWLEDYLVRSEARQQRRAARPPFVPDAKFNEIADRLRQEPELSKRLSDLKESGLNKTQCILTLWGIKKGASKSYKAASQIYDDLSQS